MFGFDYNNVFSFGKVRQLLKAQHVDAGHRKTRICIDLLITQTETFFYLNGYA